MRARSVVEKKSASRVGAQVNRGLGAFDEDLRGGTRDGREQPVQAVIASDILDAPGLRLLQQFVVAFGDAEDGIDGFNPFPGDALFSDHGREHVMKRFPEPMGFIEKGFRRLTVTLGQDKEAGAPLGGDNARCLEESDEFLPMELLGSGSGIDEIEGEASAQERVGFS
jgi:hypothetical protein